jgi:2-keto-4-pentenoate hydratase/2-oxohepta-3-ene-1,7-dioic acid hydratase in catechol pathway
LVRTLSHSSSNKQQTTTTTRNRHQHDLQTVMRFWEIGRTIVCVGRNYAAHARELNNPVPSAPFFFLKPVASYVLPPNPILIPYQEADVHHEVELGVVIGCTTRDVLRKDAMSHVAGTALLLLYRLVKAHHLMLTTNIRFDANGANK